MRGQAGRVLAVFEGGGQPARRRLPPLVGGGIRGETRAPEGRGQRGDGRPGRQPRCEGRKLPGFNEAPPGNVAGGRRQKIVAGVPPYHRTAVSMKPRQRCRGERSMFDTAQAGDV